MSKANCKDVNLRRYSANDVSVKYKLFFGLAGSISGATMERLLDAYENEENIYNLSLKELEQSKLLTKRQFDEYKLLKQKYSFENEMEKIKKINCKMMFMTDANYPQRLSNIRMRPYMLQYCGGLPEDNIPSVAIIGSRNCSSYGKDCAQYFGSELGKRGIQIISGLADGVDGISQRSAIKNGGKSFGILGCGVDICYPYSNIDLFNELKNKGGVISEFGLGTKPKAENFPIRNRLISGFADVVLVVEARERSGTSITVGMALDQGKIVYAVPGHINDRLSEGCNRLISEGAGIALSVQCIIDELQYLYSVNNLQKSNWMGNIDGIGQYGIEKSDAEKEGVENVGIETIDTEKTDAEKEGELYANTEKMDAEKMDAEKMDAEIMDMEDTDTEYEDILKDKSFENEISKTVARLALKILAEKEYMLEDVYNYVKNELSDENSKNIMINDIQVILMKLILFNVVDEKNGFYRIKSMV